MADQHDLVTAVHERTEFFPQASARLLRKRLVVEVGGEILGELTDDGHPEAHGAQQRCAYIHEELG